MTCLLCIRDCCFLTVRTTHALGPLQSLTAATTPARMPQSPGPSKPRAASLPERRYHSSNTGMLNKIGVTPLVTPTKPIVIKHTVSAETGNENETDLQDSVLEVIQH
ncbi:uncharacterized protein LOC144106730 [Amblyomma americanum]